MLHDQSGHCKYFGALTLTVYINTYLGLVSSDAMSVSEIAHECLFQAASILANDHANQLAYVARKLLSNVSILYARNPLQVGPDPVSRLVGLCLAHTQSFDDFPDAVSRLTSSQHLLLLIFLTIIVEDIRKGDSLSNSHEIHASIHNTIFPILQHVLRHAFSIPSAPQKNELALQCCSAWIQYITYAETNSTERYEDTNCLIEPLIAQTSFIMSSVDAASLHDVSSTLNTIFAIFTEIVETNQRILRPYKSILHDNLFATNKFGNAFCRFYIFDPTALQEHQDVVDAFIGLIIAYLNMDIIHISRNVGDPQMQQVLDFTLDLSRVPGIPIIDETISAQFLLFWEEFVNVCAEDERIQAEMNNTGLIEAQKSLLLRVSTIYWNKLRLHNGADTEFSQYRCLVADMFLGLYSILNIDLYVMISDLIVQLTHEYMMSGSIDSALNLEASLYLLMKITSEVSFFDDSSVEILVPHIENLLANQLIELVERASENGLANARITLLHFLSSCQSFFKSERGFSYLAPTFNFLFAIIMSDSPGLKNHLLVASKTVLNICQDANAQFAIFLPELSTVVHAMIKSAQVDTVIRERMVNAYVVIGQSLKSPEQTASIISELLLLIHDIANTNLDCLHDASEAADYSLSLLSCVNEIGKATTLPDDVESYASPQQIDSMNAYWDIDPLEIRSLILNLLKMYSCSLLPFLNRTLVSEKCCSILLKGLSEPINGPFKFSLTTIVSFMAETPSEAFSTSASNIYKLAEKVIQCGGNQVDANLVSFMVEKLFTQYLTSIEHDIDLVKACIDLFAVILSSRPSLILALPAFNEHVLTIASKALEQQESFVIKLATKFWVAVLTLKRGDRDDHLHIAGLLAAPFNATTFGQHIVHVLLTSFLGNPRSNIENFYPLFRAFIGKVPLQFKAWLANSVQALSAAEPEKIPGTRGPIFVSKLMVTRGQRQAHEVLKQFWLEYNQLVDYKS